jgi:hypothetical protein
MTATAMPRINFNLVLPATIIHPSSTEHDPVRKSETHPLGPCCPIVFSL